MSVKRAKCFILVKSQRLIVFGCLVEIGHSDVRRVFPAQTSIMIFTFTKDGDRLWLNFSFLHTFLFKMAESCIFSVLYDRIYQVSEQPCVCVLVVLFCLFWDSVSAA